MGAVHRMMPSGSQLYCIVRITSVFASALCGVLLILAMTFDRFYGIIRPHKASSFNTVKRAKVTCLIIIIFSIIYNIPHIFFTLNRGYDCIPYGNAMVYTTGVIYYWLSFIVNYSFPFVALLVMNSFIIHTIRTRKKFLSGTEQKMKTSERQTFIILLLVTFSFLLLTTPAYMLFLFNMIIDFNQSPKHKADFQLFYVISQKTRYTNNGINFFLYILSGTKFRNDFKHLFGCGDSGSTSSGSGAIVTLSGGGGGGGREKFTSSAS